MPARIQEKTLKKMIQDEKEGAAMYAKYANVDPIFSKMARDEEGHRKNLELLLRKQRGR